MILIVAQPTKVYQKVMKVVPEWGPAIYVCLFSIYSDIVILKSPQTQGIVECFIPTSLTFIATSLTMGHSVLSSRQPFGCFCCKCETSRGGNIETLVFMGTTRGSTIRVPDTI